MTDWEVRERANLERIRKEMEKDSLITFASAPQKNVLARRWEYMVTINSPYSKRKMSMPYSTIKYAKWEEPIQTMHENHIAKYGGGQPIPKIELTDDFMSAWNEEEDEYDGD